MQKIMKWFLTGLAGLAVFSSGLPAQVAKSSSSNGTTGNNIGFSVAAQLPKNQVNRKESFFDLKMTKGQTQTLKTTIYNSTNRDIKVTSAIHTAYTNTAGAIEYVTPGKKYDSSLKYKMSDITKLDEDKAVTVPAHASKVVSVTVKMPSEQFNGAILGGWYFKRVNEKTTGEVKGATNVSSEYSYVLGIKYNSGTTPAPVLKLSDVSAGIVNYHTGVVATLRNTAAVMIPKVTTKTTITSKNSGKTVKTEIKKNVMIAPNTTYNYPLLFGKTKLQAGTYHLHMVAKNSDHKWTFDRDFKISAADAKTYNKKSMNNSGISIWWLVALGALGMLMLVLLVLLIIFLIRKRRKDKDEI